MISDSEDDDSIILKAINTKFHPYYSELDSGSGRLRLSSIKMNDVGLPFGSVAKIKLNLNDLNPITIIATVWPDNQNILEENEILIDDSVIEKGDNWSYWTQTSCELLGFFEPRVLQSVGYIVPTGQTSKVKTNPKILTNIAVVNNSKVKINNHQIFEIIQTSPNSLGVISHNTILIEKVNKIDQVDSIDENYSYMKVVGDIMKLSILPTLYQIPTFNLIKGFMLLGPPGVGKTFSIKALKYLCRTICKVNIFEINIPELLSDENPVETIKKALLLIKSIKKKPKPPLSSSNFSSNSNSPVPKTPQKTSSPSFLKNTSTPKSKEFFPVKTAFSFSHPNSASQKKNSPFSSQSFTSRSSTPKGKGSPSSSSHPEKNLQPSAPNIEYDPEVSFLILDELDALGNQGKQSDVQIAIKNIICDWFDDTTIFGQEYVHCCLIATSNRVEDIDISFRRGGRFEKEINVISTLADRQVLIHKLIHSFITNNKEILDKLKFQLNNDSITTLVGKLAEQTGGYVAADLVSVFRECEKFLHNELTLFQEENFMFPNNFELNHLRNSKFNQKSYEMMNYLFHKALKEISPSCLRGVSIQIPSLSYDDVIGNEEAKKNLKRVLGFSDPKTQKYLKMFGLTRSLGGILLYGPPGNSKTKLVMAAASSHGLPVISLSTADIYSPYVGDAEAEIRKTFQVARQASPCILFLDELDSIVTNRSNGGGSSNGTSVESRILATLLTEMDGICGTDIVSGYGGVIVIGATNRLDFIDDALIRKGRFYNVIHVGLPNLADRGRLVEYFCTQYSLVEVENLGRDAPVTKEQVFESVMSLCKEGVSGAEIENICKEMAFNKLSAI